MGLESIIKGWTGELKTKFVNSLLLNDKYKAFNNIIIHTERVSTQIDHVIVSPYGIFVMETKDKTGWIFGNEKQPQWTEKIFNKTYKFQNPLYQNYGHTKSLSAHLGIEHEKIHSLAIFWGDCEFKTPLPDNVCKGGIFNSKFKQFIQSKNKVVFLPEESNKIQSDLTRLKEQSGFLSILKHASDVSN